MSHKKLSLFLGLSLLSAPAFSKISLKNFEDRLVYDISADGMEVQKVSIEGREFNKLSLIGVDQMTAVHYEVGAPHIPVLRFYAKADKKSDIKVSVLETKSISEKSISNILPVLPSLEKTSGNRYDSNDLVVSKEFLTENSYQIEEVGIERGEHKFLITLFPISFEGNVASLKRSFKVELKKPTFSFIPMEEQDGIVFIVGSKFKNSSSIKSYIKLKETFGFKTFTLNVSENNPDKIRDELKSLQAKNKNIKFALIIGDAEDISGKDSEHISGTTDHYYAALGEDYQSDINSPDLFVGRITAKNNPELDKIFGKMTKYLNDSYSTQSLLDHISFIATDDRYEVAEGTHNYVIDTYTKKAKYKGVFPKKNQAGGDKLYAITHKASTENVMEAISKGRTIINYSGHGAHTYWAGPVVTQENVRSLKSTTFPFVISNACITGDFREEESFAETWIRHENGAIVFLGSLDSSYWDEDDIFEKRMFDGIFTLNKQNFGEINDFGLAETWRHYGGEGRSKYYRETYHLFGDPSLKIKLSSSLIQF